MKKAILSVAVRCLLFFLAFYAAMLLLKPFTGFMNMANTVALLFGLAITLIAWVILAALALFYVLPSLIDLWRLMQAWFRREGNF